ncbi:MAG: ATP-binding protein [Flavobacteriales bacterium]
MTIRTRLGLQFMLLASLVLGGAFLAVYLLSADYRSEEFNGRLRNRGTNAAMLLIQVDEVSEALLKRIERDNPVRLPEEAIRIFDHHNTLIFHLGDEGLPPTPNALLDQVRLEGTQERRAGQREEIAFPFNDRFDRFVVVVSGNDIFGRSKLKNLSRVLVFTFLVGVLLTFVVGRLYARRALDPLQRLVSELRSIGPADLARRVPPGNGRDEIAQLATSFNELLGRLQEAFAAQRNFIANASHEMRTPLTTISGQLDVLLLKPRTSEEYATSLRSVLEDMRSLNTLADRLLLLAQAETQATAASFKPVRLDEVLWAARSEVLKADPRYRVSVDIGEPEDGSDVEVPGNEALLRSLVTNLMENGCKYAPDHQCAARLGRVGDHVRIEVTNAGEGISAADQERIFEPFFRTRAAGAVRGHGIGLSLVRRITLLHGGTIHLRSSTGAGVTFTVLLPMGR